MLSNEFRQQLKLAGIRRDETPCRVCSLCGQPAAWVQSAHPLDEQIADVKLKLRGRFNQQLDSRRHWLESIRHRTSRCCGKNYEVKLLDRQQALWDRWVNRWEEVRCSVVPVVRRNHPNVSDQQALSMAVDVMRHEYGAKAGSRDDDFIILSHLLGRGDRRVKLYLQIFRAEELRQAQVNCPLAPPVANVICDAGI